MKRVAAWFFWMSVVTLLSGSAGASMDTTPPDATKRRIVLHGVDCFERTGICPDARPVFDEALSMLKQEDGPIVICAGTATVNTVNAEVDWSAQAVRDYLVAGGIAPAQLRHASRGSSRDRRVELRLP